MTLQLTSHERAMLAGSQGDAAGLAMRVLTELARVNGAPRLVPIKSAHVGGLLYNGRSGLDFARHLNSLDARVTVPTTLNAGSVDLRKPDAYHGDRSTAKLATELMQCYVRMGGKPTWTCAPYLLPNQPAQGDQVVWSESGAVVYANSALGARTDRYGAMTDICAAIAGRAPYAGLHVPANRAATVVLRLTGLAPGLMARDALYQLLGYLTGERAGSCVAAIQGLPRGVSEDQLRALSAASATSGGLGMVHVIGVTPEAPTLEEACQGGPVKVIEVNHRDLVSVRERLGYADGSPVDVDAVCLGTPHFSLTEFSALVRLLRSAGRIHPRTTMLVTTNRHIHAQLGAGGLLDELERMSVTVLTDVCSYNTCVLPASVQTVMTNSAKWAHYGPGKLGVRVILGSLYECVMSAVRGRVWWNDKI